MKSFQNPPTDVSARAMQILKTVLLLDRNYSAGYIARILTADDIYGFRKDEHRQLETFGALEGENYNQLENLMGFLIRHQLLTIEDQVYGTIGISEAGTHYLSEPKPLMATRRQLSRTWYEMELIMNLRQLRREMAEERELAPYELFSNFAINRLVDVLPENSVELSQIPSMINLPEDCWSRVLEVVRDAIETKAKDEASGGLYTKAHSPSHRKAKELFDAGKSLEEIAREASWKPATVENYLLTLHKTGQINLHPWIEKMIPEKDLHRGAQYFAGAGDGRMEVAHKTLGLDYDTLRWCRLYSQEKELAA